MEPNGGLPFGPNCCCAEQQPSFTPTPHVTLKRRSVARVASVSTLVHNAGGALPPEFRLPSLNFHSIDPSFPPPFPPPPTLSSSSHSHPLPPTSSPHSSVLPPCPPCLHFSFYLDYKQLKKEISRYERVVPDACDEEKDEMARRFSEHLDSQVCPQG